jgi:hypothetical protein
MPPTAREPSAILLGVPRPGAAAMLCDGRGLDYRRIRHRVRMIMLIIRSISSMDLR